MNLTSDRARDDPPVARRVWKMAMQLQSHPGTTPRMVFNSQPCYMDGLATLQEKGLSRLDKWRNMLGICKL